MCDAVYRKDVIRLFNSFFAVVSGHFIYKVSR